MFFLKCKERFYFIESFFVNKAFQFRPLIFHIPDGIDTFIIFETQFIPESSPGLQLIVPLNMMKPEKQVLRTSFNLFECVSDFRKILSNRIAPCRSSVKAYPD
jgi:hypothetical protein